jgi:AcrR family transcriptional regulator
MTNLTNRQKQAIKSKFHISDVALNLFKNNPYEKIKITDICKEANVSVGAFYHYFQSKEDIINITYQELDSLVEEKVINTKYDSDLTAIIDINYQAGLIMQEMGYGFVSAAYQLMMKQDKPITTDNSRPSYILLNQHIKSALEKGELTSDYKVEVLVNYFMMIARGVMLDWCLNQGKYDIPIAISKHIKNGIISINMKNSKIEL